MRFLKSLRMTFFGNRINFLRKYLGRNLWIFCGILLLFYVSALILEYRVHLVSAIAKKYNHKNANNNLPESNVLENSCKFPILLPEDPNIQPFIRHVKKHFCSQIQPDFVHQDSRGYLHLQLLNETSTICKYRPFAGTLYPKRTEVEFIGDWKELNPNSSPVWVPNDQYLVECRSLEDEKLVFSQAYAHIGSDIKKPLSNVNDQQLSINMIAFDSTSLNQFRRHMKSKTIPLMKKLGFIFFEGYNKVADNSMVNLMPLLTGLRYYNQSDSMPSDINPLNYDKIPLNMDKFRFLWKIMQEKGCATMFNDDIEHYVRGLFHYPEKTTNGFYTKPTDHYFRPWYVFNYRYKHNNSTRRCFGNDHLSRLHLNLIDQFIRKYNDKCHFSFNFLVDFTHDDPNDLEQLDIPLAQMLRNLEEDNKLNKTILVVMGDHGNRVHPIKRSFVGVLEERLPLMAIYAPKWLQKKHSHSFKALQYNSRRFVSNYDVYRTLLDMIHQNWDASDAAREKYNIQSTGYVMPYMGQSLFDPIPVIRSCEEAGIPEQHCTCLKREHITLNEDDERILKAQLLITNWLRNHSSCKAIRESPIKLNKVEVYQISQMVRHGVRYQTANVLEKMNYYKMDLEIEYLEIIFTVGDFAIKARFQNEFDIFPDRFFLNTEPILLNGDLKQCSTK